MDNFMKQVEEMREAQRQYFTTRDGQSLRRAKGLESAVDKVISARRQEEQMRRFGGGLFGDEKV